MSLVPIGALAQIRQKVGPKPDEGLIRIRRSAEAVVEGAGFTDGADTTVDVVAARFQYIGNLNASQREKLGLVRVDADYIITAEAFSDIRDDDTLDEIALPWTAGKFYFLGQKAIPNHETGKLYRAVAPGKTGTVEPVWPQVEGKTVQDGAVTWLCLGDYPVFKVVQLMGPATFGDYISNKIFAQRRQL